MSNFIVAKGLGGGLLVTSGWGGELAGLGSGCIFKTSTGALKVYVRKGMDSVRVVYIDTMNAVSVSLPATAEQLAGTEWMIIKINRSGSNLIFTLDKNDPVTVPLDSVITYGGVGTVMPEAVGKLFDPRFLKRLISKTASDYYVDDLAENDGNEMLPKR